MSKAFTKENDGGEGDKPEEVELLPKNLKNYMTPTGFAALQAEFRQLMRVERPKVVEVVAWAAGNGDRSENGDYIYGKKRLREIDRRVRYLSKRLESAEVVDPARQQGLEQVFFGATVCYAREDDSEHTVTLVGVDEANIDEGKISWISPVAKALMKKREGDTVELHTPAGSETLEVVSIEYRILPLS
ncbi:MAG: transcription elongation factor GreB [Alphaproteobacteria bacterium]|nr:transcription elongation factor GreB [Alphaproteobacteria bacterium]